MKEFALIFFVGLTAIAILIEAIVAYKMWVSWQQMKKQMESFMKDAREVMVPAKSIAENLKVASANLVEIGISAREQFHRVESMVAETNEALHVQIERLDRTSREVADRVTETSQVVQNSVLKPFREVSAIIKGFSRGFDVLVNRRNQRPVDQAHQDEELFI